MGLVDITIRGAHKPCSMKLELDPDCPTESTLINHIFQNLFYEPDASRIFTRVLREGDQVIDVGGNVGYFTVLAAALVGPSGRVVTFEPDPDNIARLRNNCAINGFDNVTIIEKPAIDSVKAVEFFPNLANSGGSALWDPADYPGYVGDGSASPSMTLQATTLDWEIERLGLDRIKLIKVDTEGADHSVLKGASYSLAAAKVPFVLCELHEFGLQKMGSSAADFRRYMSGHGYQSAMIYFDGSAPVLVPDQSRITTEFLCNILFSTAAAIGEYWPVYHHLPGNLYCNPGDVEPHLLSPW